MIYAEMTENIFRELSSRGFDLSRTQRAHLDTVRVEFENDRVWPALENIGKSIGEDRLFTEGGLAFAIANENGKIYDARGYGDTSDFGNLGPIQKVEFKIYQEPLNDFAGIFGEKQAFDATSMRDTISLERLKDKLYRINTLLERREAIQERKQKALRRMSSSSSRLLDATKEYEALSKKSSVFGRRETEIEKDQSDSRRFAAEMDNYADSQDYFNICESEKNIESGLRELVGENDPIEVREGLLRAIHSLESTRKERDR